MSTPSPTSPPKRPRLSLQIRAIANGPTGRTSRTLAAAVDVKSPTSFNTLSNVYATAVDRSTPVQDKPPATVLGSRPTLRVQTQDGPNVKARNVPAPYTGPYLDTPLSAQPPSPAVTAMQQEFAFPSTLSMAATPPLSAVEQNGQHAFQQTSTTPLTARPRQTPMTAKRRTTLPINLLQPPYAHTRSLRSILRNSPLPPLSTKSPESPRRQSVRLQEKAARRVAYNSPLCQTITTSLYTRSHVDLLADDTPTTPSMSDDDVLDQTMAYTGNETRDGGQTPGPFEEMRRRMATLQASTPLPTGLTPTSSGGIRKRGGKKKEKKRRWVWTIGQEEDEGEETGTPMSAVAGRTPRQSDPPSASPRKSPNQMPVSVPVISMPAPRPRSRTRLQTARASGSGGGGGGGSVTSSPLQVSVPVIAVPVPPKRATRAGRTSQQSTPISTPVSVAVTGATPTDTEMSTLGSELLITRHRISHTPEPVTAIHRPLSALADISTSLTVPVTALPEPPTPSLSVDSSATGMSQEDGDQVFEHSGDVEMSDVSSMCSETETGQDDSHSHARQQKTAAGLLDLERGKTTDRIDQEMLDRGGLDVEMDTDTPVAMDRPDLFGEGAHRGWAPFIASG